MSKCFCHFNGYEVKDAKGRRDLATEIEERKSAIAGEKEERINAVDNERAERVENVTELANALAVERARINNFTALGEGSTTGDAELIDARTDYQGITYENVGVHIRSVSEQLSSGITNNNHINGNILHTVIDNKIITQNMWNSGKLDSSMTPITDSEILLYNKYIIVDLENYKNNMYFNYSNVNDDSLYTRTFFFDSEGALLHAGFEVKAENGGLIIRNYETLKKTFPSIKYVGISMVIKNSLNELVPILDSEYCLLVMEEYTESLSEKVENFRSKVFKCMDSNDLMSNFILHTVIDNKIITQNMWNSGKLDSSMTPITDSEILLYNKYIIVDLENYKNNMYFNYSNVNDDSLYTRTFFFDSEGALLQAGFEVKAENGGLIIRNYETLRKTFPSIKYVGISMVIKNSLNELVPILDSEYCLLVMEEYTESLSERIDNLVSGEKYITVDKNGCGKYTSISEAVENSKAGDTIIVNPGVYEESVHAWGKNVNIVGIDKNSCILKNGTGHYSTPPLEMNIGSISNMTIIADTYDSESSEDDSSVNKSYGIHVEYANDEEYSLRIENCIIKAKWNACIGAGVRFNQTLVIKNCEMETECTKSWSSGTNEWIKQGAIFFHNDINNLDSTKINTSNIVISDCIMKGKNASLSMYSVENGQYLSATFINNTLYDSENGIGENTIYRRQDVNPELCGHYVKLNVMSHGNNVGELNYNE